MTTDPHSEENPISTAESASPRQFVAEESHTLTCASSSSIVEATMRASRKTSTVDHLVDDERPWADHLSSAERERLTTYLAAHPERAPAHFAAHLSDVGILARPASPRSTAGPGPEHPEKKQS